MLISFFVSSLHPDKSGFGRGICIFVALRTNARTHRLHFKRLRRRIKDEAGIFILLRKNQLRRTRAGSNSASQNKRKYLQSQGIKDIFVVPEAGIEPARPLEREILSLLCLPFHHPGGEQRDCTKKSFLDNG